MGEQLFAHAAGTWLRSASGASWNCSPVRMTTVSKVIVSGGSVPLEPSRPADGERPDPRRVAAIAELDAADAQLDAIVGAARDRAVEADLDVVAGGGQRIGRDVTAVENAERGSDELADDPDVVRLTPP